jgi:cholesterol transport system auxiliary component
MTARRDASVTRPGSGRIARAAVATLVAIAAQGCVGNLLESDAPVAETYRLGHDVAAPAGQAPPATADPASTGALPPPSLALVVARPRSPSALDTNRIAIEPGGSRFDYYAGVRWAEPAPQMLQQNLVTALEASGRFAGVLAAPARSPVELMLDLELRHFEATAQSLDAAPTVHVQVQASLVDSRRAVRVTSFVSEARVTATENRRPAIIEAFESASARVVDDVVRRVDAAAATLSPKLQ